MKLSSILCKVTALALLAGASGARPDELAWSKHFVPVLGVEACMSVASRVAHAHRLNVVVDTLDEIAADGPTVHVSMTCIGPVPPRGTVAVMMVTSPHPQAAFRVRQELWRDFNALACGGDC